MIFYVGNLIIILAAVLHVIESESYDSIHQQRLYPMSFLQICYYDCINFVYLIIEFISRLEKKFTNELIDSLEIEHKELGIVYQREFYFVKQSIKCKNL